MTMGLHDIVAANRAGARRGITSVCSAHPLVIEAALRMASEGSAPVLIEATCNQVNQDGGYTGMTPGDFRDFVGRIAARVGMDPARIVLGGDHLGPNPWKHLPAEEALRKAEAMIAAYAAAGFTKLHLDTSMGCRGEPTALDDAVTAGRAARLAAIAEAHGTGDELVYVIGTEVPVPGGAVAGPEHLQITRPASVRATHAVHQEAFEALGLGEAFGRVIAIVVQPGVEFGHSDVIQYDRGKAAELSRALADLPGLVFEAHSTDYQTGANLRALVEDGFAILKVGPWLTFALREALYALDGVADVLDGHPPQGRLMAAMEAVMTARPEHWARYYEGDATALWLQRHFSLSDRIRYYWPDPAAAGAVAGLYARLQDRGAPQPVLHQFLGARVAGAAQGCAAPGIVMAAVQDVLGLYAEACSG